MAGVQRLQEIKCFSTAHFTEDDPVGPMPQGGPKQIADGHGRNAGLFPARLEADQIRLVDLDFRRVFDQDNTVSFIDERSHGIEHGGFAGARAAADENVLLIADGCLKRPEDFRSNRADAHQFFGVESVRLEFSNGQRGSADTARWVVYFSVAKDGGDARTVRQPGIQQGLLFGDVIAELAGNQLLGEGIVAPALGSADKGEELAAL